MTKAKLIKEIKIVGRYLAAEEIHNSEWWVRKALCMVNGGRKKYVDNELPKYKKENSIPEIITEKVILEVAALAKIRKEKEVEEKRILTIKQDELDLAQAKVQEELEESEEKKEHLLKETEDDPITITQKEYRKLCADSDMLNALEIHGVDNWTGYEFACDTIVEWTKENK